MTATRYGVRALGVLAIALLFNAASAAAQELPELTAPVNDFAHVIDEPSARSMEALIRSLQQASGDVIVVATVETIAPYADIREYAVKLFENHGRGIGQRGKDNGLLLLLAVKERQVRLEVGYDLEQFITDGFSGQISRENMVPEFRRGAYGAGLLEGVSRSAARIAQGRNVTLQGIRPSRRPAAPEAGGSGVLLVVIFIIFVILNSIGRTRRRRGYDRHWGGGPWSGWNSGVGPFGGGFGGGMGGGGGFGGGFGGFGGGRSGGGGGGAGW